MALVRTVRSTRSRIWIIAGALAVALAVGYAALHLPPVRRLALRLVLNRLERSGIIARAGGLDYKLATFEFHLTNLTLATPAATADPFFAAKDVRVRLTPGILFGDLVLKDIAIDEPRVFLTTVGASNWPGGSDTPSSSPRIRIEHARVTGLTFRWLGPQSSADLGVSFELTANGGETAGRITATRPATLSWRDHHTSVQTLEGRLSWNGSDLGIGALSVRLPEGTITADGRIEQLMAAPRLDMHVVADADLAVLAPWFDLGRAMSGTSRADVTLTGPLSGPDAAISLTGRDVAAKGVPPASLEAAARVAGRTVELTSLRARLAGGSISATGQASFDGPGAIRAEWHDVDLAAVLRDVLRDAPSTTRVELAARLSGTLDARWTAPQLEQLELTADVQAVNDAGGRARSLPVAGSATFALRALGWQLSTDDFGMPGARVSGRVSGVVSAVSLSKSSIEGSIHIGADDVGRLAGALARSGQIQAAPNITGNAAGDFTVSGLVGAPSLDGPVHATIGYESLAAAAVRAQASIAPDAIRVQEIDARLGASTAQGDLEWSRGTDALRGMVNASVAVGDLTGLSAAFSGTAGRVGVSASLFGTLAHARATIAASSAGLDVAGQHIDRSAVEVSADLERSRFVVDRLTMQSGSGRIDGRGEIDLTRDTYAAHLVASDVPVLPVIAAGAEPDVPISGRLNGTFDGEGSFSKPGGTGHVSLAAARWKEADLGSISADVTLDGRTAIVSAAAPDLAITGNGSIGIDPQGAVAVRGEWAPSDVGAIAQRFALAMSTPVSGSAAIRFELNGARDRLDEARTVATVDALTVGIGGQTLRLARPGRIEYDGRTARAGNIGLAMGTSTLVIDGAIGDQAASGLTAALDGSLADFAFVSDLIRPRPSGAVPLPAPAGSVQLGLAATGALAQPVITGSLQVAGGVVPLTAQQSVTGIGVNARLAAGVLTVDSAAASFEGASLTASARVPGNAFIDRLPAFLRSRIAPADGPASLTAQLTSITPAIAAAFVDPQTVAQLGGRVDATVQLEADRLALDRVRGFAALDRADLSVAGVAFDQRTPTRVAIRDGRLTVEAWDWGRDDNRIVVRGGATLGADSSLDLVTTTVLDLRVLNILTPSARVQGRADAEVRVGGSVSSPTLAGWVTVSNGEARIAEPRLVVSDLTGTVTLAADTLTFQRIFATVNGGDSEIAGTIRHRWFTPLGGRVTMVTNGAALAIEGLRAEANVDVALEAVPGRPVITGTVTLVRSTFREQLSLTSGVLRALQAPTIGPLAAAPSPLDRLRLDVRIVTESDLIVDNNYGEFTARADLRLVGTASRPSVTGRATLGEGGSIFLGTRRYRLKEGGSIDFANPARIEPDLNLQADARVQSTDITLTLAGTPATLQTRLTSDNPEYTESDLASLLLVGRTASEAAAGGLSGNKDELIGLLSSEFLGTAGRAVGLSTLRVEDAAPDVRFDAGLVATETDPGTRLTVGRNIGSRVEVVFSQSLHQSGALTWIVSYSPKSNLQLRVVNLDDGGRVYDFRHDLTFGRPANATRAREAPRVTVSSVQITGAGADEPAVRSRLALEDGDRFSFFRWQDDRERIEGYFHEHDRLEARVVTRRTVEPTDSQRVGLLYDVRPGLRTTLQVEGAMLRSSAIREIKRAWTGSVIDDLLQEEVVRIARGALVDAGYVQAGVTTRIGRTADEKRLTIRIETGTRAGDRRVRFAGNHGESTDRLLAVLAEPRLARAVWIEPEVARDALVAYYRANGYLNATIRVDPILRAGGTVTRPIEVDEGEAFRIRNIRVEGATSLSPADVIAKAGLARGEVLTELKMEQARAALDQSYRALGFNSVDVTLQSETSPDGPVADLAVRVDEAVQQRLRAIATKGLERTRPSLVSRALKLDLGEPVNLAAWNESRRRLYETGAFRSVDIEREVIQEFSPEAVANGAATEPVRAMVSVQEWPRFRLRYGVELNDTAQSDSEDPSEILPAFNEGGRAFSLGATGDLAARNLLGRALTAGVAGRYTIDFRAARTYATMPTFLGRRITSTLFLERSHEGSGVTATGLRPAISTDKTTLTFQQSVRPLRRMEVQYGYSIERNHTFDLHPDPADPLPFDILVTTPKFTSSVILDMRNDLFDATAGWFHNSNVEYAPEWLATDLRLARFYAQQRYYRRAGKVVLATWAQIGLATGFDQTLIPSDRFFAGGGNSVRGYEQDAISPTDFLGTIVGGNALLVLNQEVRFPLFPYVRGVGFIDAGRAFETVGQMSLKDLAAGTGIGVRVQTPVVLLRFDMGVPLDAAFGTRRPRWFFSIGQMF